MSETASGPVKGVLEVLQKGGGFLRDPARSFSQDKSDIFVPQKLIQKLNLTSGALVVGISGKGPKGPVLAEVRDLGGGQARRLTDPGARPVGAAGLGSRPSVRHGRQRSLERTTKLPEEHPFTDLLYRAKHSHRTDPEAPRQ